MQPEDDAQVTLRWWSEALLGIAVATKCRADPGLPPAS
jgi:hypothetical protein